MCLWRRQKDYFTIIEGFCAVVATLALSNVKICETRSRVPMSPIYTS